MKPEREFVKRLGAMFGSLDPAIAADTANEYANALAGQTKENLEQAANILAREHRIRAWPTIAECLDAVSAAKRRSKSAGIGLMPIDGFDGWWGERMARIRHAENDAQIEAELKQIEPYADARWIASSRMREALEAADQRRKQWATESARTTAERMGAA